MIYQTISPLWNGSKRMLIKLQESIDSAYLSNVDILWTDFNQVGHFDTCWTKRKTRENYARVLETDCSTRRRVMVKWWFHESRQRYELSDWIILPPPQQTLENFQHVQKGWLPRSKGHSLGSLANITARTTRYLNGVWKASSLHSMLRPIFSVDCMNGKSILYHLKN